MIHIRPRGRNRGSALESGLLEVNEGPDVQTALIGRDAGSKPQMRMACTPQMRLKGLLGHSNRGGILLLVPCCDIHTVGMDKSIDVAFLGEDGRVFESYRNLQPGKRVRSDQACAVVERIALPKEPWLLKGDSLQVDFRCGNARGEGNESEEDCFFEMERSREDGLAQGLLSSGYEKNVREETE